MTIMVFNVTDKYQKVKIWKYSKIYRVCADLIFIYPNIFKLEGIAKKIVLRDIDGQRDLWD